jgi:hypothetical protein
MGLWDILRGNTRTKRPNLDNLFALPSASITLQTALGVNPTGVGSVCFRAAEGAASVATTADAVGLIEADQGPHVEQTTDGFGFTWLVVNGDPAELETVVTDLHAVNTSLETQGFAAGLLCSMVAFVAPSGQKVGLVYLYKQGTFYPFAPRGGKQRDVLLERQVRDALATDLPIEPDTDRWMPVWGAPGL